MKLLIVDYEGLARNAAAAMKRVTSLLERAGLKVVDVASDGKTRRLAGVSFREVTISFADSQKLALRVKATGDVYEVRINGKQTPVSQQDDAAKAIGELAGLIDRGRARFQKRLAAMRMRPPESARTAAPKLKERLQQQIAEVDSQIEAAKEELAELATAA